MGIEDIKKNYFFIEKPVPERDLIPPEEIEKVLKEKYEYIRDDEKRKLIGKDVKMESLFNKISDKGLGILLFKNENWRTFYIDLESLIPFCFICLI
jgi:pseudouridine-5'-phosphate glycosidase